MANRHPIVTISGRFRELPSGDRLFNSDLPQAIISTPVILTDASTIALDASLGNRFRCSSAVDRTLGAPSNGTDGQQIVIRWKNTDSNPHTLTLTTGTGGFRFGSDITTLSATVAGKADYITAEYNSSDNRWDLLGFIKGY